MSPGPGKRSANSCFKTAVQCVSALPCLHLHELPDNFEALGSRELTERVPLGLNPETGAPLPG